MKKLLFFVNPMAGTGTVRAGLMDILQEFAAAGYEITVHPTQGPRELSRVIAERGDRYDLIVVSGGDGTLNETTAGLMCLPPERRRPIGYIPAGTVNDVASTLRLKRNPLRAARDIVTGEPFPLDVGRFGDRWFNYVAAFGLFTDVSYRTPQQGKQILGRLAYLLDGAKSLVGIRSIPVTMRLDGETVEENVLAGLVTSTTSVGGFRMKNKVGVSLNDGVFEVLLVRDIKSLADFNDAVSALLRGELERDTFVFRRASHVEFTFPQPTDWTVDGEYGGTVTEAVIDNHRAAVQIIVPKET